MVPLVIYRYLLILLIIICCLLIYASYKTPITPKGLSFEMKMGVIWVLILLIVNFINMYYTLLYYDNNKDKKGPKGPKGFLGSRGIKGGDLECSQCGNAGKTLPDIYATNVNDYNVIVNNSKVKIGKCIFPFIHNNETHYTPIKELREEGEINDAYKNGWCATSLNPDKTFKTYGYTNMSKLEKERREKERLRSLSRKEYLKNNSGIIDIKLVSGNRSSVKCPSGYEKINKDLNEASGGKYLYLCKKEGLSSSGISDIKITTEADNYACDIGYRKIPYNLNKDSGGKKLFLCHKKSKSGFITGIKVQNSMSCPSGYTNISGNVNAGSGGNEVYICTTSEPNVSVIAVDTAFLFDEDKKLYFFKGDKYWMYDDKRQKMESNYPKNVSEYWGKLPKDLDGSFTYGFDKKTYFFKGSLFYEYDIKRQEIAPGYPKYIKDVWKGIPSNIDAVFTWDKDGRTYFFKGKFYYRFDDHKKRVERGYPKYINRRWPSRVPFNNMNAIFSYKDGNTYVIRGDKYWEIGPDDRVSNNFPRQLSDKFPGLY